MIIVTGDRDSYQLVADPHVKVLYNRRGVSDYALYDEAGIEEKTGVTPALYPQYAALRGDTSDNLPGVPGVGEKTAAKLITTYGGLDGIFANVDAQTPKLKSSLIEHEARARKNLDLMILRHDAPLDDITVDDLGVDPNAEELQRLFDFLEFRTLGTRLAEALGRRWARASTSATARIARSSSPRCGSVDDAVGGGRRSSSACRRSTWRRPGRASPGGARSAGSPSCATRSRPTSLDPRRHCSPTIAWPSRSPGTTTSGATTSSR